MRRVRYCKICKDNVRGFDHHCPAFGNCIGERNHILFMVLLIGFIAVESLYILCTAEFTKKYEMRRKKSEIINPVNVAASTMFFCLLQVLWQVVFLSWHIYCIGCNIRTDEWINWKKYPEFQLMVTSVKSARQVIDALNAEGHDIDIILLEVDLHLKKGFKLLKYIMRDKELQRIPVIMMSAQDEVSTVVKCLSLSRTCKALAYQ